MWHNVSASNLTCDNFIKIGTIDRVTVYQAPTHLLFSGHHENSESPDTKSKLVEVL